MVGYLRLHPDSPLTFDCSRFLNTVGSFDIEIDHLDPLKIQFLGPEAYHVGSVQLLQADHAAYDLSVSDMHLHDEHKRIKFVPPYTLARATASQTSSPNKTTPHVDPDAFVPGTIDDTSCGPDSKAPYTKSFVDANLPGGIFEKTPYLGFAVLMSGTCIFPFCRKCDTATENTTEAEMTAGNHLGKALRWLHLFMDNLGLAFDDPIPVAEDNAATQIIVQTGKLTCNVRHIALKTISLQNLVYEQIAMF
jgi:hypothetical protein